MTAQTEFPLIFEKLKSILEPYSSKLKVTTDAPEAYYLDGPYNERWKKEIFFSAAHIKKNYVSFYLMPVYMFPDLLKNISPELKKHMQGKSCFNFKKVEPVLFDELAQLTHQGFERFIKDNTFANFEIAFFDHQIWWFLRKLHPTYRDLASTYEFWRRY